MRLQHAGQRTAPCALLRCVALRYVQCERGLSLLLRQHRFTIIAGVLLSWVPRDASVCRPRIS